MPGLVSCLEEAVLLVLLNTREHAACVNCKSPMRSLKQFPQLKVDSVEVSVRSGTVLMCQGQSHFCSHRNLRALL